MRAPLCYQAEASALLQLELYHLDARAAAVADRARDRRILPVKFRRPGDIERADLERAERISYGPRRTPGFKNKSLWWLNYTLAARPRTPRTLCA
jgi:hypothetical protein